MICTVSVHSSDKIRAVYDENQVNEILATHDAAEFQIVRVTGSPMPFTEVPADAEILRDFSGGA